MTVIDSARYSTSADPQCFGIGVDAEYDYGPVPWPSERGWFGACEHEIVIRVAKEDQTEFPLNFELLDAAPPAPPEPGDVEGTFLMNVSSGSIGVNEVRGGFEPELLTMDPGRYYVRITGYGRTGEGDEQYLIQFWPTSRT